MEEKNMREISMEEMDRVSGGSGVNSRLNKSCPNCFCQNIEKIRKLPDGRIHYKCTRCKHEWEK